MVDIETTFENGYRSARNMVAGGAAVDMNFNTSPGHCSSRDGSFIQDEDMHLILEFGGVFSPGAKLRRSPAGGAQYFDAMDLAPKASLLSPILSSSAAGWRSVAKKPPALSPKILNNAMAYDAEIVAQLDFDDFSAQRDMALLNFDSFGAKNFGDVADTTTEEVDKILQTPHQKILTANGERRKRNRMLQNSVEVSLFDLTRSNYGGGSLFSSDEDDFLPHVDDNFPVKFKDETSSQNDQQPISHGAKKPAFISTDSLDFSCMSINEQNLKQACAPNKCDYVLTFDKNMMSESGVGAMSCCSETEAAVKLDTANETLLPTDLTFQGAPQEESKTEDKLKEQSAPQNSIITSSQEKDDQTNCNITTWGRIKRSYERKSSDNLALVNTPGGHYPPKCVSLPELKPAYANQFCRLYAGERMASGLQYAGLDEQDEEEVNLTPKTSPKRNNSVLKSSPDNKAIGFQNGQLIREFQQRQHTVLVSADHDEGQQESGYVTGEISNHNINGFLNLVDLQENYTTPEQCKVVQNLQQDHSAPLDYEYAEFYVNGRYIDMNHNEIGYTVPQNRDDTLNLVTPEHIDQDAAHPSDPPAKPPRTFITLLEENQETTGAEPRELSPDAKPPVKTCCEKSSQTDGLDRENTSVPDQITVAGWSKEDRNWAAMKRPLETGLDFLKLPFEIPALNAPLTPFLANFLGVDEKKVSEDLKVDKATEQWQTDFVQNHPPHPSAKTNTAIADVIPDPPKLTSGPFSPSCHSTVDQFGLDAVEGPNHVQDWASLATLLPADVVQACRFFRQNSGFLRNIDKPDVLNTSRYTKRSSMSIRGEYDKRAFRQCYRCCAGKNDDNMRLAKSPEIPKMFDRSNNKYNRLISLEVEFSASLDRQLMAEKMEALEGLIHEMEIFCTQIHNLFNGQPMQTTKQQRQQHQNALGTLIFNSLCPALESLIADGLLAEKYLCDVMKTSRIVDIATRSVCSMILNLRGDLRTGDKSGERSLQFAVFVDSLLSSRALDIWLSDLISDRRLVSENYSKHAYLSLLGRACSSRLIEHLLDTVVGPLRHLPFDSLRLIDVEISSNDNESSPSIITGNDDVIDRKSITKKCSNGEKAVLSNLVVLQRELRIVFRFPATTISNAMATVGHMRDYDVVTPTSKPPQRPQHIELKSTTMGLRHKSRIPSPCFSPKKTVKNNDDVIHTKYYKQPATNDDVIAKEPATRASAIPSSPFRRKYYQDVITVTSPTQQQHVEKYRQITIGPMSTRLRVTSPKFCNESSPARGRNGRQTEERKTVSLDEVRNDNGRFGVGSRIGTTIVRSRIPTPKSHGSQLKFGGARN